MAKVVVITGSSAGVGRATAREFAKHGCSVGLIARDQQRLDEAAVEMRGLGVAAAAQSADVADFAAVDRAATQIEQELGPIDIWVNNAMATIFAPCWVGTCIPRHSATVSLLRCEVRGAWVH